MTRRSARLGLIAMGFVLSLAAGAVQAADSSALCPTAPARVADYDVVAWGTVLDAEAHAPGQSHRIKVILKSSLAGRGVHGNVLILASVNDMRRGDRVVAYVKLAEDRGYQPWWERARVVSKADFEAAQASCP